VTFPGFYAGFLSLCDSYLDRIIGLSDLREFGLNLDSKLLVDEFDATSHETTSSTGKARLKEAKLPPKDSSKWAP
jgi:hypothetical protein